MKVHDPTHCGECGRRERVTYRCTGCPYTFEVDGEYRYYAQGRGHWHTSGDDPRFRLLIREHRASHVEFVGMVPVTRSLRSSPVSAS